MSQNYLRIASKNLKKFTVIFHMNIYLHEFFQIFLSNRVLWRKIFVIVCFSPFYLNGKNEVTRSRGYQPFQLDPLTIWNIFYYFFGNDFQRENEKKTNLGNKERPSIQEYFENGNRFSGKFYDDLESLTFFYIYCVLIKLK